VLLNKSLIYQLFSLSLFKSFECLDVMHYKYLPEFIMVGYQLQIEETLQKFKTLSCILSARMEFVNGGQFNIEKKPFQDK